jgi:hypothetical protein
MLAFTRTHIQLVAVATCNPTNLVRLGNLNSLGEELATATTDATCPKLLELLRTFSSMIYSELTTDATNHDEQFEPVESSSAESDRCSLIDSFSVERSFVVQFIINMSLSRQFIY